MDLNCNKLLNLFFPPLCLHCKADLEKARRLFCLNCLELLTPLDVHERCLICFSQKDGVCKECVARYVVVKRQAAVCSTIGPGYTLFSHLQKGNIQLIAPVASLMALQFVTLGWPLPDWIIALPVSFSKRLSAAGNIAFLLAKAISNILDSPILTALSRGFNWHAFFEKGEFAPTFFLRRKNSLLHDKRILLVSLELEDGLFRAAGTALLEGFVSEIFGLGFILQNPKQE